MVTTPAPRGAAAQVLARAAANVDRRRRAAVEELELAVEWAAVNGHLDDESPAAGPRLVAFGGQGTPAVVDVSVGEFAIARRSTVHSTHSLIADALDLAHRLPRTWTMVRALELEAWVARRVARRSRRLPADVAAILDGIVADAAGVAPGRMLDLVEAKLIELTPEDHQLDEARTRQAQGVWFSAPKTIEGDPTETGHRHLFARLATADAIWLDATVDRVADLLARRPDHQQTAHEQLRALALGLLGRPTELAALLGADVDAGTLRPDATVYVHLTPDHLDDDNAGLVARVEEHGPVMVDALARLLGHARITLKPVIDLNSGASHNAYEHPATVRERSRLRMLHDAFPHSASMTVVVDQDHVEPYVHDPTGPPGQTGDHNTQPLTRRHHRIKTHTGMTVRQVGPARYVWSTPQGLHRIVSQHGTVSCSSIEAELTIALAR